MSHQTHGLVLAIAIAGPIGVGCAIRSAIARVTRIAEAKPRRDWAALNLQPVPDPWETARHARQGFDPRHNARQREATAHYDALNQQARNERNAR